MQTTNAQARKIINDHVKSFTGIPQTAINWENQANFKPPTTTLWCRVTIDYADSKESCLYNGLMIRDYGIVSIQCFAPKGTGDIALVALADAWREHWNGFNVGDVWVTKTHAPKIARAEPDDLYIMALIRADFNVN